MFDDEMLGLEEDTEEAETSEEEQQESEIDGEVLKAMLMTGENTEGTFTPDEDDSEDQEDLHQEVDEEAEVVTKEVREKLGDYENELLFDLKENPDKYKVKTSQGELPLIEALQRGWNPATRDFDGETKGDQMKRDMAGLSEADREALQRITDPSAAHIPPAEAEKYGLDPDDPMVDKGQGGAPQGQMPQGMGMPPGMGGMM